jgi:hypothetical protein
MGQGQKPRLLESVIQNLLSFCVILAVLAAAVPGFAAAGITVNQMVGWLRFGVWVSRPTSDFVSLPLDFLQNWLGARAIVDWFMAGPVQVPLILCSLLLLFLIGSISEALLRNRRERNRQKPPPRDY